MPETAIIVWSLIFGSIGFGYFIYGRKQSHALAKYSGIVLIACPYLVTNVYLLLLIGFALMALPYFYKL